MGRFGLRASGQIRPTTCACQFGAVPDPSPGQALKSIVYASTSELPLEMSVMNSLKV